MQIGTLIAAAAGGLDIALPAGAERLEISGIAVDSRDVRPGDLFVAIPGTVADGARYVPAAVANGAVAVLAASDAGIADATVPVLRSSEPRRALALLAAAFSGAQPEMIVAVTGTSGKTSVADFTRQILAKLGKRAASLGTIGIIKPDGAVYGSLTTPDPVSLHRTLAGLAGEGIMHLAFEASSHGLDQHRLDGVRLTAAAFTNLGRDHMDYHSTVEDYLGAKLRLFNELLQPGQTAVVNTDGALSERVVAAARGRGLKLLTVGRGAAVLKLRSQQRDGFAQLLEIDHDGKAYQVPLPLVGAYQVENALTAAGLAIAAGCDAGDVIPALASLQGVPGRLELVAEVNGALAVVDYAHKPEALQAALSSLRPFVSGKLICVVGCGGDRDKGKRPLMGRIAVDNADVVIVTDDNPRGEVPAAIRAEILSAAPGAREIGDRGEAISAGVAMLEPGDVLVVAGKGHETGQKIGDRVIPFSDHDAIRAALGADKGDQQS